MRMTQKVLIDLYWSRAQMSSSVWKDLSLQTFGLIVLAGLLVDDHDDDHGDDDDGNNGDDVDDDDDDDFDDDSPYTPHHIARGG